MGFKYKRALSRALLNANKCYKQFTQHIYEIFKRV